MKLKGYALWIAGSPNLTAITGPELQGSATIDFDEAWPVVEVDTGASLTLQGLVVKGRKSAVDPDVQAYFTYWPRGLASWPNVHAHVGSEVRSLHPQQLFAEVLQDCCIHGISVIADHG